MGTHRTPGASFVSPVRQSKTIELPIDSVELSAVLMEGFPTKVVPELEYSLKPVNQFLSRQKSRGELTVLYRDDASSSDLNCLLEMIDSGKSLDFNGLVSELNRTLQAEAEVLRCDSGTYLLVSEFLKSAQPEVDDRWGCWWGGLKSPYCGDFWGKWTSGNDHFFIVCDGVGHGEEAQAISFKAFEQVKRSNTNNVRKLMVELHEKLKGTRGAVAFIGRCPPDFGWIEYCSVGNVSARLLTESETRTFWSNNGTVGYKLPQVDSERIPVDPGTYLMICTDGVELPPGTPFDAGFFDLSPTMNAARLLTEFGQDYDDALVAMLRV